MRLEVDGRQVDPTLVTYNPGVGFGKFNSDRVAVHRYELFMDRSAVIADLSEAYAIARDEIRADDEKYGDVSEFSAVGYADLDEAFDSPEGLAEIIDGYFCRELLDFHVPVRDRFVYVINSVDRVTVTPDGVLYEGRCFRHLRDDPTRIPGWLGAAGVGDQRWRFRRLAAGALQAGVLAALLVLALRPWFSLPMAGIGATGLAVGLVLALHRWRGDSGGRWLRLALAAGIGAAAGTWLGAILFR